MFFTMGYLMDDHDLFTYPNQPGFREPTTSRAAAQSMKAHAPNLRDIVLAEILAAGERGLTPDEAAALIGATVLSIRPRFSELAMADPPAIVDTGKRRPNASGRGAKAWKVAQEMKP
jgi:hypothetical protein